jgi:hypothetical protein
MVILIIPPLQSPHEGDSNGGQIIKIGGLSINKVIYELIDPIICRYVYLISSLNIIC